MARGRPSCTAGLRSVSTGQDRRRFAGRDWSRAPFRRVPLAARVFFETGGFGASDAEAHSGCVAGAGTATDLANAGHASGCAPEASVSAAAATALTMFWYPVQ